MPKPQAQSSTIQEPIVVADSADEKLERNVLGTFDIVLMVLAAAAPLAVVMGLMPIAFAFGNGAGLPGTFILGGCAMLLFAIGYVRQIPYVKNAGAFYAYISVSMSRMVGLPAAYVASLSYLASCLSTLFALAYFAADLFTTVTGIATPWQYWGIGAALLVGVLAYHRITMVAAVLAVALVAEISIVVVLDAAIIYQRGFGAFQLQDMAPSYVFAPGLGIALVYTFSSMFGIEGTAIYQEEARDARVTVPRATYIAVLITILLYAVTAWCLSTAVGSQQVAGIAAADLGHFVSDRAKDYLGGIGAGTLKVLVVTSAFAATLGLFNCATRYVYALARDGFLPRRLAKTHPVFHSPHVSAVLLAAICISVLIVAGLADLDPLQNLSPMFAGLGAVGLMSLLAVTSLGIPLFFARRREFSFGKTLAPALGGIAISACTYLAVTNYSLLTGVSDAFINSLPLCLVVVAVAGFAQAAWLRRRRPEGYLRIGASRIEEAPEDKLAEKTAARGSVVTESLR